MPTYFPLQTKVQLLIGSLSNTTTTDPDRRKGGFSTSEAAKSEQNLKGGRLLKETPISCCGENSRLHFLGLNKEVPFYLMHVGDDLFAKTQEDEAVDLVQATPQYNKKGSGPVDEERGRTMNKPSLESLGSRSSSLSSAESYEDPDEPHPRLETPQLSSRERRATRSAGPPEFGALMTNLPPRCPTARRSESKPFNLTQDIASSGVEIAPQAVGLVITTSKSTYLPAFDTKQTAQDVKIDIFCNGELTECISIPARLGNKDTGTRGREAMVQLISGRRMDALIERPWVINTPLQNAASSLETTCHTKANKVGAKGRWDEIGKAIMLEAEMQGFNNYGDCTPTGSYLASLAGLEMPEAVEKMQKNDGLKYGVIDVVVSVGVGKKGGPDTFYVKEPTRLVDENFQARIGGFKKRDNETVVSCAAFADLSRTTTMTAKSEIPGAKLAVEISKTQLALTRSAARYTGKVDMIGPKKFVNSAPATNATLVQVEHEDTVMQEVGLYSERVESDGITIVQNPERQAPELAQVTEKGSTLSATFPGMAITTEDVCIAENQDSTGRLSQGVVTSPTREIPVTQPESFKETPTDSKFSSFSCQIWNTQSTPPESTPVSSFDIAVKASLPTTSPSFDSTVYSLSAFPSFDATISSGGSFESTSGKGTNASNRTEIQDQEQTPRERSLTLQSETSTDISNLEDGCHRRGYTRPPMSKYELSSLMIDTPISHHVSSTRAQAQTGMPPPKTPSSVPAKRRSSDTITVSNPDPSAKRRRSSAAKNGSADDSNGEGELLVTRRGVFNRRSIGNSPLKNEVKPEKGEISTLHPTLPSREGTNRVNRSKTAAMIRRVFIEHRGVIVVDKILDPPLPLQRPDRGFAGHVPPSPLFPLDESVVFSLKDMTKPPPTPFLPPPLTERKATPKQIYTPMPSSSPARVPQSSPSRKPLPAPRSATVTTQHPDPIPKFCTALAAATARRRDREPVDYAKELNDAWVTPELSKDCVLGYAEESVLVDERSGGIFRHVKSARPGWFVESEVLFAVRYLVG